MNETLFINYATVLISIAFLSLQIGLMYNDISIIKNFLADNITILFPISIIMVLLIFIPLFTSMVSFSLTTSAFYQRMLVVYICCGVYFYILASTMYEIISPKDSQPCLIKTKNPSLKNFIDKIRNHNYYIHTDKNNSVNKKKECFFTQWHLSHLLLYMVVGYLIPKRYLFTIFIGLVWEGMELRWDIADGMDIFWNILGVGIGVGSRYLVEHYKNK